MALSLVHALRKLETFREPRPVASSKPAVTGNPAWPPVSPVEEGMLLLHMLGVLMLQETTPLVAGVTSWNADGALAAS